MTRIRLGGDDGSAAVWGNTAVDEKLNTSRPRNNFNSIIFFQILIILRNKLIDKNSIKTSEFITFAGYKDSPIK